MEKSLAASEEWILSLSRGPAVESRRNRREIDQKNVLSTFRVTRTNTHTHAQRVTWENVRTNWRKRNKKNVQNTWGRESRWPRRFVFDVFSIPLFLSRAWVRENALSFPETSNLTIRSTRRNIITQFETQQSRLLWWNKCTFPTMSFIFILSFFS